MDVVCTVVTMYLSLTHLRQSQAKISAPRGDARFHASPQDLVQSACHASASALSFFLGAGCGRITRSTQPNRISLTLATAMNNSSAAAVLASTWFPRLPGVLLPILCYSLLQKTAASAVATRGPAPRQAPAR